MLWYDHRAAEAYLENATGDEPAFLGMLLCSMHTERFTAPVGWKIVDRRVHDAPHCRAVAAR